MPAFLAVAIESASVSDAAGMRIWAYAGFLLLVTCFLALDLGVFHREAHEVGMKEAITWSIVWVCCGLSFSAFVYFAYENHWLGLGLETPKYAAAAAVAAGAPLIVTGEVLGREALSQYLVGYVVEK
ncbi:MAG: hypothetical protein M3N56_04985, partial [Actinomycetota bacterium]|nr:hypothetical protein [Actinomycetota bacterium]